MTLPGRIRYAIPSCQLRLHSPLKRVNGSSQQLSDMCGSTSGFNYWLIRTCSTGKTINWQRQWQLEATPLPLVIFSLATAMTHFLPPQSYFLGLFPDGLIGSLLIPAWMIQALICWEHGLHLNNWLSSPTVLMLLKTLVEWLACLSGCMSAAHYNRWVCLARTGNTFI